MEIETVFEENPVIAAVKNDEQLFEALKSEVKVIFVLYGDLVNIQDISRKISHKNKIGILHIDLVEGLGSKAVVNKFIKENTDFSGIISTKPQIIKSAKEYNLAAVQRVFIFDNLSLENAKNHIMSEADALEVLPGVIPKVFSIISNCTKKPVIAGGLIESKEEVVQALKSGASCVSTSKKYIWSI